jgi:hypothetical protein
MNTPNLKHHSLRLAVLTASTLALTAGPAQATDTCPNSALRVGPAAALADCRAYELVSSDLNHALLPHGASTGLASPSGEMIVYMAEDAPEHARSSQPGFNLIRATRDAATGWTGVSLSPPLSTPVTAYWAVRTVGLSSDLSTTLDSSDQPLSGSATATGANVFVGHTGGTYRQITAVPATFGGTFQKVYGAPGVAGATPDFSHVYLVPSNAQVAGDPTPGSSIYTWSEEHGLQLLGILPDGTPAPSGASFAGNSADGRYAAFLAGNQLYLRVDESRTIAISTSQRTVDPDPNPPAVPAPAGVSSDGRYVLFTSQSELTNDANTGRSGGVATDAGRDLYRYDIATGELKDLTVDTNPADTATGANVLSAFPSIEVPVVRATPDASVVYFAADGTLAPGGTPGRTALYAWHDDRIDFVADAGGLVRDAINHELLAPIDVTPDGRHLLFSSTDRLTGYDNTDPVSGLPHSEVFLATLGAPVVCASCRPDGTPPVGDSTVPRYNGVHTDRAVRAVSADGSRVFFDSTDAVLLQASGGHQQVYEYSGGRISPISHLDSSFEASFIDASASGDDVFFKTHDDLVPNPNSGDEAVFDARVGGGFPVVAHSRCSGVSCRAAPTPALTPPVAASVTFVSNGNLQVDSGVSSASTKVSVSQVRTITGATGALKVKVPQKGTLILAGDGVVARHVSAPKAQTITLKLALTAKAARTLRKQRTFKTRVRVRFTGVDRRSSTATVSLTFKRPTTRKAR